MWLSTWIRLSTAVAMTLCVHESLICRNILSMASSEPAVLSLLLASSFTAAEMTLVRAALWLSVSGHVAMASPAMAAMTIRTMRKRAHAASFFLLHRRLRVGWWSGSDGTSLLESGLGIVHLHKSVNRLRVSVVLALALIRCLRCDDGAHVACRRLRHRDDWS